MDYKRLNLTLKFGDKTPDSVKSTLKSLEVCFIDKGKSIIINNIEEDDINDIVKAIKELGVTFIQTIHNKTDGTNKKEDEQTMLRRELYNKETNIDRKKEICKILIDRFKISGLSNEGIVYIKDSSIIIEKEIIKNKETSKMNNNRWSKEEDSKIIEMINSNIPRGEFGKKIKEMSEKTKRTERSVFCRYYILKSKMKNSDTKTAINDKPQNIVIKKENISVAKKTTVDNFNKKIILEFLYQEKSRIINKYNNDLSYIDEAIKNVENKI